MPVTNIEIWQLVIQAVAALGGVAALISLLVALIRPKLRLLLDSKGERTRYGDPYGGELVYFYHLKVRNKRNRLAKNVHLKLIKANKSRTDGSFPNNELHGPVKLRWARQGPDPCSRDIVGLDDAFCNLGYLIQDRGFFQLDACLEPLPPNFILHAGERMRVEAVAVADNAKSNALCFEIAWDGQWHDEPEEMQKHLVVQAIRARGRFRRA